MNVPEKDTNKATVIIEIANPAEVGMVVTTLAMSGYPVRYDKDDGVIVVDCVEIY